MKPMDSYTPIVFIALSVISAALKKASEICIAVLASSCGARRQTMIIATASPSISQSPLGSRSPIEYYVPEGFQKPGKQWIPPEQCGKIIPFPAPEKKSA
jgi:hypothetical protein